MGGVKRNCPFASRPAHCAYKSRLRLLAIPLDFSNSSFLHKASVRIQDPVKPVDRFPFLFPKEIASQEPEKVETPNEHISIATLFKEEEKEPAFIPIYEPL